MGSIEKIHEMLVSKECSCTELTKSYLDEIEKADGELNAYVNVTGEEALKTAEAVDRKIASGEEIGMLEGVPMTLKDNISTKGIETTCCSKILTGYKPIYNATVWETLAGENAVMLGKTNMDEFAMGSSCETSYFGGAMNPFDSNYVSGGSSGGVASAVGANIAAYGLGSDTDIAVQDDIEEEESLDIVRQKRFNLKPMDSEEAILQMNMLGHNFFVFTNAETNLTNVVYRRNDGKYGLIEPTE